MEIEKEELKLVGSSRVEQLSHDVIGAAIEVHRALGPGLLEGTYEKSMCLELTHRGIPFNCQHIIPVEYRGVRVGEGRVGLLVDNALIVELKAVEALASIHTAQLISYLRASRLNLGLLINFDVVVLKNGIKRVAL